MRMLSPFLIPIAVAAAPALAQSGGAPAGGAGMPVVEGRGVYVTQIGQSHTVQVSQSAPNAYANVRQEGERNEAVVDQRGDGIAYSEVVQSGDRNRAAIVQDGPGSNFLTLTQSGQDNQAAAQQNATPGAHNGAILTQVGNQNVMALTQDGSDNQAVLTQQGDGNQMAASQTGDGNRLTWTQDGFGLPSLGVAQTGAQAIQITQTGGR
ncbi:hypothetical protein [Sphingosinicella terrae]|uniref:hypothetical protein n=1 Tax=Sphingosinicella terrae TaxID=2172047 RepID=UPI000E0D64F1|nr:hypothetical protein [Sphingosinicella terrae]